MLTKIMKYDFKAIGKNLLPLYILTVSFALLTRALTLLGKYSGIIEVFGFFADVLTLLLAVVLLFMTFAMSVKRFYSHLFKEEGYLTNMLPVKLESHIISKFIISACYCMLTVFTITLSLYIIYYDMELIGSIDAIVTPVVKLLPSAVTFIILTYLSYILLFMSSYSVGQIKTKNKISYSFVSGAIIYLTTQSIALIALFILNTINPTFLTGLNSANLESMYILFTTMIILQIINICIYYIITTYALKKKMDLE